MKNNNRNILFITTIKLSSESGGAFYSKSIYNLLSSIGNVDLLVLSESQIFTNRILRFLASILGSLFNHIPPNINFHSRFLSNRARSVFHKEWDYIFFDHLESSALFENRKKSKFIYLSHNQEAILFSERFSFLPSPMKRIWSLWIECFEKKISSSVDAILTISSKEAQWYQQFNQRVEVIYPFFNVDELSKTTHKSQFKHIRIGFLGPKTWTPNRIAFNILLKEILPLTNCTFDLVIAGRGWDNDDEQFISKFLSKGGIGTVRCLGFVNNINDFWSQIDVLAAPITMGAGVNIKVCEAIAYSCPVIALPHAMRGLEKLNSRLITQVSTNAEFAKAIDTFEPSKLHDSSSILFDKKYAKVKISSILDSISVRNH